MRRWRPRGSALSETKIRELAFAWRSLSSCSWVCGHECVLCAKARVEWNAKHYVMEGAQLAPRVICDHGRVFVGGLFLIGARTKRKLAALSAPEDWAARPVRVLMPGGDIEFDAASNAAATKVQAILRGSKARKSVAKPRKSVAVIIPVAGRAEEVRSSALARAACPPPADAPASPPPPPSPAACEPALRLRRQCW